MEFFRPNRPGGRPRFENEEVFSNPSVILIEAIRKEFENIHGIEINNDKLSQFLGFNDNYITKKYHYIRKGKQGYITPEKYDQIKGILSVYFSETSHIMSKELIEALEQYEDFLTIHYLKRSSNRSRLYHPNLKEKFFEIIDTIEKAYWLGFMYADGYVIEESDQYRTYYRIGLKVNIKDEEQIDRFINAIGLNNEHKHRYKELQEINGKLYMVEYYRIHFANQVMAQDLIKNGVIPNKSKQIRLPNLCSCDLLLAFLLGYYDGDGETGTSRIWSGSYDFLEDIKQIIDIPNEIQYKKSKLGEAWGLSIGPRVFNAMLDCYKNSMERKRKKLMIR